MTQGYSDYRSLARDLQALGASKYAEVRALGRTLGGRDVLLVEVGAEKRDEKPAMLIVGGIDPPYLLGSELALRFAKRLVEQADKDQATQQLLQRVTFYIIPRAAPDACEAFFQKPYSGRSTNNRPVDDDHDGKIDEDGPDDLNGDGMITMMRVAEATGSYIEHPGDPRVMIKADREKGEQGKWSLYTEGRDNDGDGKQNEDPPGGVAFSRNFTHEYPYFASDAGPHQVSEAETRAVADFAFERANIAMVFSFSTEDNLMRPWTPNKQAESERIKTAILTADAGYVSHLAKQYRDILGAENAPKTPERHGSMVDWAYFHYGRWSLASRGWWMPQPELPKAAKSEKNGEKDHRGADDVAALKWYAQQKIDGFVPWEAISHPDFPGRTVEVGGFKPFLRTNPPAKEIDRLAEKHDKFLLRLCELLPRIAFDDMKVTARGSGVYRLTATVVNRGFLPTMPEMGRVVGDLHPLQIAIELPPGASLVTGSPRARLPVLAGGGGKAEHSWLLVVPRGAKADVVLRAWSPSVGSVSKHVALAPDHAKAQSP